jgi:hypothetical protein
MILTAPSLTLLGIPGSGGESDAAQFVASQVHQGKRALYETYTFGHAYYSALSDLVSVQMECGTPDWDGYGAQPVRNDTVWIAYLVLESLPPGLPEPRIGAEPDGQVTLEWHQSPRRTLSVSVSPDSFLHYSALIGPNKQFGTEVFSREMPQNILSLIRRVLA